MFETPTVHQVIKKVVIGFGTLFSKIQIPRTDENGVVQQYVNVPIAYGPKEKGHVRVDQDPTLDNHVYVNLPRIGFEIAGYNYDGTRMVNRNNKIKCFDEHGISHMFAPVPYNIDITMYVLTKGTEDGLSIVEQILPLFTPEYTLNLNAVPSMNLTQDVPIILSSISVQSDYEGDFQTRQFVTHTFSFVAKVFLYGPIKTGAAIITNTTIGLDTSGNGINDVTYTGEGDTSNGNNVIDDWTNFIEGTGRVPLGGISGTTGINTFENSNDEILDLSGNSSDASVGVTQHHYGFD